MIIGTNYSRELQGVTLVIAKITRIIIINNIEALCYILLFSLTIHHINDLLSVTK